MNITGGTDLSLLEVNEAAGIVAENADEEANIIFGADIDESMGDALRITVIATGFEQEGTKEAELQFGSAPRRTYTAAAQQPVETPRSYAAPQQTAPIANAFSARSYAEPAPVSDPSLDAPIEPARRDPSADVRRDYNDRPANKLDIPAFLRK